MKLSKQINSFASIASETKNELKKSFDKLTNENEDLKIKMISSNQEMKKKILELRNSLLLPSNPFVGIQNNIRFLFHYISKQSNSSVLIVSKLLVQHQKSSLKTIFLSSPIAEQQSFNFMNMNLNIKTLLKKK